MSFLINRKELLEVGTKMTMGDVFPDWQNKSNREKKIAIQYAQKVKEIIKTLPRVDAVEVVRCKDCQYGIEDTYGDIECGLDERLRGRNCFCSEGVKGELVRCRECQHRCGQYGDYCAYHQCVVSEDDLCNKGERKVSYADD